MLEDPTDVLPQFETLRGRLAKLPDGGPVAEVLEALAEMAKRNEVKPELAKRLATAAGAQESDRASDLVLDPQRLTLRPVIQQAVRSTLPTVLTQPGLSDKERALAEEILAAVSNIEELLAIHFARFLATSSLADRRTYLYLAWILWAFLKVRAAAADRARHSVYDELKEISAAVITFNYTDFFPRSIRKAVLHFHGRLDEYLRADSREVVGNDEFASTNTVEQVVTLFEQLRLDVTGNNPAIDIPAIVPPTTFKPVLSRAQLRTWAAADAELDAATRVVVVGYSFAQADEHFNDLLRKSTSEVRVITRNATAAFPRAARPLGIDPAAGKVSKSGSVAAGRLSVLPGRAENLDSRDVAKLLG